MKGLPLQGQLLDNIGKGRLLGMLQGRRLLQQSFPQKRINPQKKMHPGVVDTANLGHGTPITTELSIEREKGAHPVNMEMSVEL